MKVFEEDAFKEHIISSNEASIYWVEENYSKYLSINLEFLRKSNSLWTSTMNYAERNKFTRDDLK